MNITKRKNIYKALKSKKGISLVLAIALSIVLCMATATFVSIALLQQNDTGSELNTRQAYISSKGSIETAEKLLTDGSNLIKVPTTGTKYFYVMYYDGSTLKTLQCYDEDEAKQWIKDHKDVYKIIGDTYVVVSNDGSGNCRITAAGTESKYSGTNGSSRERKLSKSFKSVKEYSLKEEVTPDLTYEIKKPNDPVPPSKGTDFLAVGMQTNYSLLYSYRDNQSSVWSVGARYAPEGGGTAPLMNSNNEAGEYKNGDKVRLVSQMPLVFNYCLKCTTDQPRNIFTAGEYGVYFLGDRTDTDQTDYDRQMRNAAFFTDNAVWAPEFRTAHVVINHNMYTKRKDNDLNYGINVSYDGSKMGVAGGGSISSKVCVYISNPSGVSFNVYDTNTKKRKYVFTLAQGVYTVPSGYNLFDQGNYTKVSDSVAENYGLDIDNAKDVIKLNAHAGFESVVDKSRDSAGIKPVSILSSDSTCQKNSYVYGNITETSAYQGWKYYDIFCAPNWMPGMKSSSGYEGDYHWYSGSNTTDASGNSGSFNFLWYSVNDMMIKTGVNIHIHSANSVLSIGPDKHEWAGEFNRTDGSGSYKSILMGKDGDTTSDHPGFKQRSNVLVGQSNSEFWLKPYWGETGFTVNVKNAFIVRYGTNQYTVKEGEYKFDGTGSTAGFESTGINLFTDKAMNYFKNAASEAKDSKKVTPPWVDSSDAIINSTPSDQSGKIIKFEASSGGLAESGVYKAKSILAKFTQNPLLTRNAKFNASYIEINTKTLEGTSFYINTLSGCNDTNYTYIVKRNGTKLIGNLVYFGRDTTIRITTLGQDFVIPEGYYFFETGGDTNLLNKTTWESGVLKLENGGTTGDKKYTLISKDKIEFSGGYY